MNPSRLFIERPVATALLMLAVLLAGLLAYRLLPIAALPEVDYPTLQVSTFYPGASPEVVATTITAPLERQFGQIPGLAQMSSSSSGGASLITLRFTLGLTLDVAQQEVQAAINAANTLLPADLPMPPVFNKVNPADAPVLTIAISSPSLPVVRVHELVESRLAQKISQVPGVGLVSIAGGARPAVRIQVDPAALRSAGLSMEDLRNAVGAANVSQAKGSFDGPQRASTIDANDQLKDPADYARLILAYKDGRGIRLQDVATIKEDAENLHLAAWADTTPAVILNVRRQPGANVIDTVDRVRALLPALQATLPASIDVQVLSDRTVTIRASVRDVQHELLFAIALVVMVIFLFLRNVPATVIPSVAVPLSLVGTFGVMVLAGFSINNLTLMALTISTGFVVDDAIVMIENIARHIEAGETPFQAALKGSKQIAFTIISLTVSLIAVLIPLLFMGDVVGRLFHEFAITLAVAILISAVVSLTLTPMMCARLLKAHHAGGHDALPTQGFFGRLVQGYDRSLTWVLDRPRLTLLAFAGTLGLTVLLYLWVPKGFFPQQDTGVIQAVTEASPSVSFAAMAEEQQAMVDRVLADEAVQSVSSFIGIDGANPTLNTGRLQVTLKPLEERHVNAARVMQRLQSAAQAQAGMRLYLQPVQDLSIEDRVSKTQYQFTLSAPDEATLRVHADDLLERLRERAELRDVASDHDSLGLQAYLDIDRDAAARLGVSVASIDTALYNAYGQRQISTIFTQSSQYRVVLELAHAGLPQGPALLNSLYVPGAAGQQVPLSAIAKLSERRVALAINRAEQFPAATLSFNLAPGVSLGEAVQAIQGEAAALHLPPAMTLGFEGAAAAFQASLTNTLWLIAAAVVTMYIVLGVLYESTIHPLTILSTLPSAGLGALLALLLAGLDLDMIAIIGIVLLIGIVKKNAIMMIDFALDAERNQGLAPRAAIHQACLLRLRPILMTTLAALLGALPMMLGTGVGSELRHPLGVSMVGGLIVSQLLTLYSTPVIYLGFGRLAQRLRQRKAAVLTEARV